MRTVELYRQNISICSVAAYNLERGSPSKGVKPQQTHRPYTASVGSPQKRRPDSRDASVSKMIDESLSANSSYVSKGARLIVNKLRL